jgi:hypothetical protein
MQFKVIIYRISTFYMNCVYEEDKIPCLCQKWKHDSSLVQQVAWSLYRLSYPVPVISSFCICTIRYMHFYTKLIIKLLKTKIWENP